MRRLDFITLHFGSKASTSAAAVLHVPDMTRAMRGNVLELSTSQHIGSAKPQGRRGRENDGEWWLRFCTLVTKQMSSCDWAATARAETPVILLYLQCCKNSMAVLKSLTVWILLHRSEICKYGHQTHIVVEMLMVNYSPIKASTVSSAYMLAAAFFFKYSYTEYSKRRDLIYTS